MSQHTTQPSSGGGPPGPRDPPGTGADPNVQIGTTYHARTRIEDSRPEIPIFLRPIVVEDAGYLVRLASFGGLRSWTSSGVMGMVEAHKYLTAWQTWSEVPTTYRLGGPRAILTSPTMIHLAIVFPARENVIGFIRLDIDPGLCKMQIALDPLAQNTGHGTQALTMAIDWVFQSAHLGGLQLDIVQLTSTQDNLRFAHVATNKLHLGPPTEFRDGTLGLLRWNIRHGEWNSAPTRVFVRGQPIPDPIPMTGNSTI